MELLVGDLATEAPANREYPYQGTGRRSFSSPIHIDKLVSKGFLEYEAEFLPSLNLRGLDFDEKNEVEKALEDDNAESGHSASRTSSDGDYEKISTPVATEFPAASQPPSHTKGARSVDTVGTVQSVLSSSTAPDTDTDKGAVVLSREQLLKSRKSFNHHLNVRPSDSTCEHSFRHHHLPCQRRSASEEKSLGDSP